jgi:dihydroflavonol-4-reductase
VKRVIVTGGSGHIGANLVGALVREGVAVRALVRPAGEGGHELGPLAGVSVETVSGDVRDRASLEAGFAGAELVFHLAALISINGGQRGRVWATNVDGAANVGAAARACGVRRVVHCSSVHAFALAGHEGTLDESSPRALARGHAVYDRSKAAGELALREAAGAGVEVVVCHPTGVIGPADHGPSRMGRFIQALMRGRAPGLVEGAFDWVDVRDVVAGLRAAGTRGLPGQNYLLSGHPASPREIAALVAESTGARAPRFVAPMALARFGAVFTSAYGKLTGREPLFTSEALAPLRFRGRISSAKAARELGFAARPLPETIRDTCAWFAARDQAPGVAA